MPVRSAEAKWEGSLKEGAGEVKLGSGAFQGPYSFQTRFEDQQGTNPEELIAAAHAGCFSMAFSAELGKAGYKPKWIESKAEVHLEKKDDGFVIPKIELTMQAQVPDISEEEFQKIAKGAKEGCPVSKVLEGAELSLDATLKQQ